MTADPRASVVRIAATADFHYPRDTDASTMPLLERAAENADVLVICGDLTNHGRVQEAVELGTLLARLPIPILAVLGNHDCHSEQQEEIKQELKRSSVQVLDGDSVVIRGVGFAGVKGFASGFGRSMLEPWGEPVVKGFVREAVEESLKLESALAQLRTEHRIALLHYAPVVATVEGEPPEIYPFLGSSRLEEPLNRFQVTAAFHGHAHHGCAEGRTSAGIPVYNVSLPLLRRTHPQDASIRILELPIVAPDGAGRDASEPARPAGRRGGHP